MTNDKKPTQGRLDIKGIPPEPIPDVEAFRLIEDLIYSMPAKTRNEGIAVEMNRLRHPPSVRRNMRDGGYAYNPSVVSRILNRHRRDPSHPKELIDLIRTKRKRKVGWARIAEILNTKRLWTNRYPPGRRRWTASGVRGLFDQQDRILKASGPVPIAKKKKKKKRRKVRKANRADGISNKLHMTDTDTEIIPDHTMVLLDGIVILLRVDNDLNYLSVIAIDTVNRSKNKCQLSLAGTVKPAKGNSSKNPVFLDCEGMGLDDDLDD